MQAPPSPRYLSPSALDDPVRALVEYHSALGAIPFRRTGGDLGKADTVEVEPFAITLRVMLAL